MGTFINEYVDNPVFEKKEELKVRLREVLLEYGECGVSQVCINGRNTYLLKLNELSVPDEKGYIELSYNRYERDWWEPTYVNLNDDNFTGVRSRGIGSKIGWAQHYNAMLVSRVLCECYSNGSYMVCGDVSYSGIISALAYIGNKYEFELVRNFIKNRCDLNNFDAIEGEGKLKKGFWGTRDGSYYYKDFMVTESLSSWKYSKEDDEDLTNAEKGENVKYCKSQYYLGIRVLYHMLEQDLKDIDNVDENVLKSIFTEYCSGKSKDECKDYLEELPEDIMKYRNFYYNNWDTIALIIEDLDIICKCISLMKPEKISILYTVKDEFLQYYSKMENLEEDELRIYYNIMIQNALHKARSDEKTQKEICEDVESIMNERTSFDVVRFSKENAYLNELYYFTGGISDFSDTLTSKIERLFSGKELRNFIKNWKFKERTTSEIFCVLFDIADKIYEGNRILLNEDFFYKMIDGAKNRELSFRLDLLWYILNKLDDADKQFVVSWVIEIDSLYDKYVKVN